MWVSPNGAYGIPGSLSRKNSMYANNVCFRVYDVAGHLVISTDTSIPPLEEFGSSTVPEGKFLYEMRFRKDDPAFPG